MSMANVSYEQDIILCFALNFPCTNFMAHYYQADLLLDTFLVIP